MPAPLRILVVDDEKVIRDGCARALSGQEHQVATAQDGSTGLDRLKTEAFDIVLLDLMMPGVDGFTVLKWIKQHRPDTQVIVITGYATVQKAVEAMKSGAFDFVGKPFTPDYLRIVVGRAAENRLLQTETEKLRREKASDLYTIVQEQSRLKTVFDCIEGAVLVTNRDGKVVLHNPAAVSVLDLAAEPVVGRPVSQVIRHPDAAEMIHDVTNGLVAVTREFEPGTVSRLHLRACCAPVHTATGKIFGSVTVFEDVTARKQVEQLKSEFVSMLAHELRAPLAAIEQMIHATRACPGEDRRSHFLDRIQERTRGLLQMIENLLNLSRLDAGSAVFTLEPARGDEILSGVVELMQPRAEEKSIRLVHVIPGNEWWISVDQEQIRSVFVNILDNAVKYTPAGGEVNISMEPKGGLAVIRITDTGIGIHAADLPNIFDRFFRVKGSATRGISGSGLGLSLAKRIVEAHQGHIDVESEPGRGTTFKVSLPLAEPPPVKAGSGQGEP
jgi:two-component system phosphate regulon sensor histidine kinase PhoR